MPKYTNYPIYSDLSVNQIKNRIKKSIEAFFKIDSYLIVNNLHENAITHRIAIYLDEIFINYNVDCEWNRNTLYEKRIFTKELIEKIKFITEEAIEQKDNGNISTSKPLTISKLKNIINLLDNYGRPKEINVTDLSGDEFLLFPQLDKERRFIIKNVRPDIIIHHRGTKQNIAVIEVKKKNAGGEYNYEVAKHFDLVKLYAMTTQKNLDYQYGFYIELPEKDVFWKKIRVESNKFLKDTFGDKSKRVFEIKFIK